MASAVEAAQSGRTVVLVADDGVNINMLIARPLQHAGYDTSGGRTGGQAMARIARAVQDVNFRDESASAAAVRTVIPW